MRQRAYRLPALPAAAFLPGVAAAAEPHPAQAATMAGLHLDGAELGLAWSLPFVGILLSIALFPLVAPRFWHRHFGKVAAFWALAFLVPFTLRFRPELALYELLHTTLLEYLPFIILLLALFTVTGGLRVAATFVATPGFNTGVLAFGAVLAGWIGTTGASMLLIRPVLRANAWRASRVHVVVFFIFLVSNIGGSLSPLGDPPLFLGFLKGVPFFWPAIHLVTPTLVASAILLAVFYVLDAWMLRRDGLPVPPHPANEGFRIEGKVNLLLMLGIVAAVLISGIWRPGASLHVYGVGIALESLVRDALLLAITVASWWLTPRATRAANEFGWGPILEVAKLFAGIFLTIVPVIAILRAGTEGALAPIVRLVTRPDGTPFDAMYFWATGILSSFLDNAPTYLVFFNTAGGDPLVLTTTLASTLAAISCGAVFMGANSYIGNAPNFMVRAIAEESGVRMPSFFGYCGWAVVFLIPIFALLTALFFA